MRRTLAAALLLPLLAARPARAAAPRRLAGRDGAGARRSLGRGGRGGGGRRRPGGAQAGDVLPDAGAGRGARHRDRRLPRRQPGLAAASDAERRREEAIVAEPDDAVALAACDRELPHTAAALVRCAQGELRRNRPRTRRRRRAPPGSSPPRTRAGKRRSCAPGGPAIGPAEQWRRFDRLAWSDTAAAGAAGAAAVARRISRAPRRGWRCGATTRRPRRCSPTCRPSSGDARDDAGARALAAPGRP